MSLLRVHVLIVEMPQNEAFQSFPFLAGERKVQPEMEGLPEFC